MRHDCIGDVRGRGLFLGVDLVTDRPSRLPATQRARAVVEACLARGVLLSADGPGANVLKIKPPIVLTKRPPTGPCGPWMRRWSADPPSGW